MICWYCHWGWPEQVMEVYQRACGLVGEHALKYGPGHIVWEDENFTDQDIQWCIGNAEKYRGDFYDETIDAVVRSLRELLLVPEGVRCCVPADYDGIDPGRFPPPEGIKTVKVKQDLPCLPE